MSTTTIVKCDRCLNKIENPDEICRADFLHAYQRRRERDQSTFDLCDTCAKAVIVAIVGEREVPTKHD